MSSAAESTSARRAYEAYKAVVNRPVAAWDQLSNLAQEGWRAAAGEGCEPDEPEGRDEKASRGMFGTPKSDDLLYAAWCVIANVGLHRGGWETQHPEWQEAAKRWRDQWHRYLDGMHRPGDRAPSRWRPVSLPVTSLPVRPVEEPIFTPLQREAGNTAIQITEDLDWRPEVGSGDTANRPFKRSSILAPLPQETYDAAATPIEVTPDPER
jgi:hypothetical protein